MWKDPFKHNGDYYTDANSFTDTPDIVLVQYRIGGTVIQDIIDFGDFQTFVNNFHKWNNGGLTVYRYLKKIKSLTR